MRFNILTTTAFSFAVISGTYAQTPQKLNIDYATVFISGAELVSTAKLSLAKGENEIQFSNVAGDVNNESIVVNATNAVVVESVTFENNYLDTGNVSPKAQEIKDSIEIVDAQRQALRNKIDMLAEEVKILQDNHKVGGDNTGLSVAELQKMLDLVNNKMEGYLDQKYKEEVAIKKVRDHLARLKKQLDEEQKLNYQAGGLLLVKFYAKEATNSNIAISYIVPHAGWSPTYDVMADDIHSPVRFYYKANVYQNSGVKWNNVHLTLSTGNPQEGMEAPVLASWYLGFYNPAAYQNVNYGYNKMMTNKPTTSTADLVALSPGIYQEQKGAYINNNSSMDSHVAVDNSGVSTSFDIDLPYTVPSDGQQHLIAVKKYEAPATYQYISIPKMDKDAFLEAHITNWEDFDLLAGPTNIFYEGVYVGHGNIDPQNVKDTMNISMGRDKKIIVKRERDKNLRSVKMIGTNVRETFAYNITVRNTRKEPVTITLQDQQPVSNDKDIVIEDKETGGADYKETTGQMKWELTLAPNETKKVTFGYTVKYPKGKQLVNMK